MAFDLDDEELKATRRMNGSDKDVGSIEERVKNYIQTYNGLKRNKDIVKSIDKDYFFDLVDCLIKAYKELEYKYNKALSDLVQAEHKNKELEEENKTIKGNYYTLCADIQMVTTELGFPEDTIIADEMIPMIKENYIPVSLVEEKIEEIKNETWYIDCGVEAKQSCIEVLQELLEKR